MAPKTQKMELFQLKLAIFGIFDLQNPGFCLLSSCVPFAKAFPFTKATGDKSGDKAAKCILGQVSD